MFYVYSHIQEDTGEVFYIGKGHGNRAYSKVCRSNLWKNVAKKHGWKAVLLCDDLTEAEAFEVEKFYIKEYGRRDLGTGNLVNLTDGGEGFSGLMFSDTHKENLKNRVFTESWKKNMSLAKLGKPCVNVGKKIKPRSEEAKKRTSDTLKGRPSKLKGRTYSDETRKRVSEANRKSWEKRRLLISKEAQ